MTVTNARRCATDITLRGSAFPEGQGTADASSLVPSTLHLLRTPTSASARKGIAWKPSAQTNLDPATSDLLLTAIARARSWMNDLSEGRVGSFEEIARSDIQHLARLAFVSPRLVEAIANGRAPANLTVSSLARRAPARLGCAGTQVQCRR
jgi:site-specific DNA recombinase